MTMLAYHGTRTNSTTANPLRTPTALSMMMQVAVEGEEMVKYLNHSRQAA